jgi:hypothetical protein
MLHYYAKHFKSSVVGKRLIAVRCDHCGCEYFYELARVGLGFATAHYGIGSRRAERAAEERARMDLSRLLEQDAELVPCPECQWINEELVSAYRRGRYRGWLKVAGGVALCGTGLSLLVSWFLSIGPATDRGSVPVFLVGGPVLSVTLATLILVGRGWLRGRIQPNRDHPFPPSIPRGCPPALVRNVATGELAVARPVRPDGEADVEWIEFQIGRNRLPPQCCECLDAAASGIHYRYPVMPAVELAVPVCSACSRRRRRRMWLVGLATFGVTTATGLLLSVALDLDEVAFWIVLVLVCGLAPLVAAVVAYRATTPVRMKVVDASRAIVRLRFRNEVYRAHIVGQDDAWTRHTGP